MKLVKEEYVIWGVLLGLIAGVVIGIWITKSGVVPYQPGDKLPNRQEQECESYNNGC